MDSPSIILYRPTGIALHYTLKPSPVLLLSTSIVGSFFVPRSGLTRFDRDISRHAKNVFLFSALVCIITDSECK